MKPKRLLIVGGVAGGASCAARARRLSEEAQIVIFERGPYVSFANCGLPYHVGNVIQKEDDLLVATPELFRDRFKIDVRTEHHVRRILPERKEIEIESLKSGRIYPEQYDDLVLSPGSEPLRPNIKGLDLTGIFPLETIPDTRKIIKWLNAKAVRKAVIVGGGFIGLEMAENLKKLGIGVSIVEMQRHVMPTLDPEMAAFIHNHLEANRISLYLGSPVEKFKAHKNNTLAVILESGQTIVTDMVILSVGVRPRTELAKTAGLAIGHKGGILVDEHMQTSDKHIWAVGDAVEIKNFITAQQTLVPLAGPANRQGRIAAEAIMGKSQFPHIFRGVQATAVCGVLGLTIASTGVSEKILKKSKISGSGRSYEKIYLHPDHHAGYYPDAKTITMKLLFSKEDGKILGAQAVGLEGVEKRIDVISMAIQKNGTVFDLEEAELCYAPQFGSAKDPVNLAGMIAANMLRGYVLVSHWENLAESDPYLLDVRDPNEFAKGHFKNAVNIPLNDLRNRLAELPSNREICSYCYVGKRSYYANRILTQKGFTCRNISGGFRMYPAVKTFKAIP
jgi:NADPH-dependent 2,4-dienoyl-CoA reductase/sulfur reductase-like enzyme/rhodanese-related sulfurtransferase